ncbi:MAG: cytochrome ubiquinol oxidase subunit I, partial [Coriobacteriales bacterium]|nr:cytochrome ubiquinol oxidase subunit I [Coriobacteriales bacterium]
WLMVVGPLAPIAAIELGWFTAEVGRQPWIVYGELKTADAVSQAVDPWQLIITLLLFLVIYTFIYVVWFKSFLKIVRTGPEVFEDGDKPLLGRIMSAVKTTAAVTVGGTEAVEAGLDAADDLEDDLLDEEVAR